MGKLSPPTLQPTITTCSNELRVSGCVPGAHVIVFDEQRVIAELASAPSDTVYIPIIATALPLKAGSKLATRQEILPNLAGDSSKFDRQVTVADPPTPPVPRFVVLHCARCVRVLGMTVGHTVIVRMNSVPIGSALAFDSEVDVSLTAGAAATMTFEAVDCKVGPPPVAQALLYIPEDPRPLPTPTVEIGRTHV